MSARVELFKIVEGGTGYYFTSDNKSVVYDTRTYIPIPIVRSSIISSAEINKAKVEVSISLNNSAARRWLGTVIDSSITIEIFKQVEALTTRIWRGRLSSIKATKTSVVMIFESSFTSLRNPGVRKRFQRTCPYSLYGPECKANQALFATAGTATAVDGVDITVPEAALASPGFYTGGIIEDLNGKPRFIRVHSGDVLTLSRALPDIVVSSAVTIYPGCARTTSVCNDTFNNLPNYGGYPYIPLKNPFGGNSIM